MTIADERQPYDVRHEGQQNHGMCIGQSEMADASGKEDRHEHSARIHVKLHDHIAGTSSALEGIRGFCNRTIKDAGDGTLTVFFAYQYRYAASTSASTKLPQHPRCLGGGPSITGTDFDPLALPSPATSSAARLSTLPPCKRALGFRCRIQLLVPLSSPAVLACIAELRFPRLLPAESS